MDNYTRVKKAINFGGPDRVPLWAPEDPESEIDSICAGTIPLKGTSSGRVESDEDESIRLIGVDGIAVTDEQAARGVKDEWGCVWRALDDTIGVVIEHPLCDRRNFKTYQFPDPYKEGRLDDATRKVETIRGDCYILAYQWSILFERMCYLMGHTNLLTEMLLNRDFIIELAAGVTEYGVGLMKRFAAVGAHGVMIGDDWGTQTGCWIRGETFDDLFKPFYQKIIRVAHEGGLDVFFHSCGNMFDLIPNLLDCGIDVLNTWQPQVIGIERLGGTYGGRVCFNCSADIQKTLPCKSPEEVRRETELLVDKLGSFNGGLIGVSYGGSTVNAENVQVMINTFRTYGVYR